MRCSAKNYLRTSLICFCYILTICMPKCVPHSQPRIYADDTNIAFASNNVEEINKYMLFTCREVRIGKNCARGLQNNVEEINKYTLFTGREVRIGKTVPEVSSTARGRRPRAVLETEGTVFSNTDRPRPVNNIFIYF